MSLKEIVGKGRESRFPSGPPVFPGESCLVEVTPAIRPEQLTRNDISSSENFTAQWN